MDKELKHTLFMWISLIIIAWLCFVNTACEAVKWDIRNSHGGMKYRSADYDQIYYQGRGGAEKRK